MIQILNVSFRFFRATRLLVLVSCSVLALPLWAGGLAPEDQQILSPLPRTQDGAVHLQQPAGSEPPVMLTPGRPMTIQDAERAAEALVISKRRPRRKPNALIATEGQTAPAAAPQAVVPPPREEAKTSPLAEHDIADLQRQIYELKQAQEDLMTFDILDKITADSLPRNDRVLTPRNDVTIDRAKLSAPFPEESSTDVPLEGGADIELSVSVVDDSVEKAFENLTSGHGALMAGQVESSIAYYRKVLEEEPENQDALFGLATSYHKNGQVEDARDVYEELIEKNNHHRPALNNYIVLVSDLDANYALEKLSALQISNPEFAPIPAQMAILYLKLEKHNEAVKLLKRALVIEPKNTKYRYNLAVLMDQLGQKEVAVRLYRQLLNAHRRGYPLPVDTRDIEQRLAYLDEQLAFN